MYLWPKSDLRLTQLDRKTNSKKSFNKLKVLVINLHVHGLPESTTRHTILSSQKVQAIRTEVSWIIIDYNGFSLTKMLSI